MSETEKSEHDKQGAENAPDNRSYKAKGRLGRIMMPITRRCNDGWIWLLEKPERLTALSTFAIFLATAVAVGVGIAQWTALRATDEKIGHQLKEMQQTRLDTIEQIRANLRPDFDFVRVNNGKEVEKWQPNTGWMIVPTWQNVGGTTAKNVRGFYVLRVFDKSEGISSCPALPKNYPLSEPGIVFRDGRWAIAGQFLSLEDAQGALDDKKTILMWGHVEYRDAWYPATVQHFDTWCQRIQPNDLGGNGFATFNVWEDAD